MDDAFADVIAANQAFASDFDLGGFDGKAHAGIAVVTWMDSRIDPLRSLGLKHGDAKIFRNPGSRVTPKRSKPSSCVLTCSTSSGSSSSLTPVARWLRPPSGIYSAGWVSLSEPTRVGSPSTW